MTKIGKNGKNNETEKIDKLVKRVNPIKIEQEMGKCEKFEKRTFNK